MKKNNLKLLSSVFYLALFLFGFTLGTIVFVAIYFNGRILLQVQDKGQAWYVDPLSSKRYYLGRPDDAWRIMRDFGLGASNKDLDYFLSTKAPARLSGRILLRVQDKGQAYYVNPLDLKLSYLGRPNDAFNVIRSFGLGITNNDLAKIPSGSITVIADKPVVATPATELTNNEVESVSRIFNFKYQNISQSIYVKLLPSLYQSYSQSPKVYSYQSNDPPVDLEAAFYGIFFNTKKGDTSIADISYYLRILAARNNWSDDQLVEATMALIQYIPYDQAKVDSGVNNPFYPYETLYLNKGICSDTTFLAVSLLKNLGYGIAIMNFPDINHSAVGIACPTAYSIMGSGYCYAETTNYFPIGVIPNSISGQARSDDYNFDGLFDETKLGQIKIILKSPGKLYKGVEATKQKVQELKDLHQYIINNREAAQQSYNNAVLYNEKINSFNQLLKDFYQQ